MEHLVSGVVLRRHGDYMETARPHPMTLHLVSAWDGTEVIRQEVPAGHRFGLRPAEGWTALECLYVLHGRATWTDGHRRLSLGPGDSVTGNPVQEPCLLEAETDLAMLYICSQPVFHLVSGEVEAMVKMAVMVEEKDGYTSEHCARIQRLSSRLGQAIGLSPTQQHYLEYGSFLHDLGKVRVPDDVLKKPGKLTADEWAVMQQHTVWGQEILAGTSLAGAAHILAQHHERLDGSGYPLGLKGDAISLEAQIVAVADSYDAMTTDRVYRKGMPKEEALAELRRGAGTLYLPNVVRTFAEIID
jgi:HD-GYP domain-containing protein (c-di-GMP phosphodiesterase class II)